MPEIQDVAASNTANLLLFADSGWGKTTFIGSGGKEYKILIIRPPIENVDPILGSGCKEAIARDWDDMDEIQTMLHHVGPEDWDWVWLDGLGGWQEVGLHDLYLDALDRAGPPGSKARKHREQFYSDKGEFRVNAERISALIRDLVGSTAFHFGVTAYPFWAPRLAIDPEDTSEAAGQTEQIMPYIQVKGMVPKICGYMNVVAYGDIGERTRRGEKIEYRRMYTNKGARHYAKCQLKKPDGTSIFGEDGVIVNPTLPKIMEAINTRSTGAQRRNRTRRPAARR